MLSKINGYINPFSKGFQKSIDDFAHLSVRNKILTITLSIFSGISTLPVLGIGGFAVFHAMVDRLEPGANSSADKTKNTVGGKFPPSGPGVSPPKTPPPTVPPETTISPPPSSTASKTDSTQTLNQVPLDIDVLKSILEGFEKEVTVWEKVMSKKQLDDFFKQKDSVNGQPDKQMMMLLNLAAIHYQITESHQSIEDLLKRKDINPDAKDLLLKGKQLQFRYGALVNRLRESLKENAEVVNFLYSETKKEIYRTAMGQTKQGLDKFEDWFLKDYQRILVLMIRFQKETVHESKSLKKPMSLGVRGLDPAEIIPAKKEVDELQEVERELKSVQGLLKTRAIEMEEKKKPKPVVPPPVTTQPQPPSKPDPATKKPTVTTPPPKKPASTTTTKKPGWSFSPFQSPVVAGMRGITNLGNSCYMNSCLQVLMNTELARHIEDNVEKPPPPEMGVDSTQMDRYQNNLAEYQKRLAHQTELQKFKAVYSGTDQSRNLTDMARAVRATVFDDKTRLAAGFVASEIYRQQDASLLMGALLRGVGYEYNESVKIDAPGIEKDQVQETPNMMSVALGNKKEGLKGILQRYGTEEVNDVNNTWRGHPKYTVERRISKEIPEVLVVQLKRFAYERLVGASKNDTSVDIPDEIDLSGNMDPKLLAGGEKAKYRLVAYVNHHGLTPNGGHYTANVKKGDKWYQCDDSSVRDLSKGTETSYRDKAYLLVLERIKD